MAPQLRKRLRRDKRPRAAWRAVAPSPLRGFLPAACPRLVRQARPRTSTQSPSTKAPFNQGRGFAMTAYPMQPARQQPDDLDDRTRRIRDKILDGIEATLDELAQPRTIHDTVSRAVHRAMQSQRAALLCRQALCRRAQRCRRDPCAVPSEDSPL
ncbi:MAG: hypothetical protein ACTHN2_01060 [Nitrobacter sp.]